MLPVPCAAVFMGRGFVCIALVSCALPSLVPRPLPDFISHPIFLHGCEIKSESGLGTRLCIALVSCVLPWFRAYCRGFVHTAVVSCILPWFLAYCRGFVCISLVSCVLPWFRVHCRGFVCIAVVSCALPWFCAYWRGVHCPGFVCIAARVQRGEAKFTTIAHCLLTVSFYMHVLFSFFWFLFWAALISHRRRNRGGEGAGGSPGPPQ